MSSTFSNKIHVLFPEKCKPSCVRPVFWTHTQSQWRLFWAETRPPSTFPGNLFSSFCVILLTNQQRVRLALLGGGRNNLWIVCCRSCSKPFVSSRLVPGGPAGGWDWTRWPQDRSPPSCTQGGRPPPSVVAVRHPPQGAPHIDTLLGNYPTTQQEHGAPLTSYWSICL